MLVTVRSISRQLRVNFLSRQGRRIGSQLELGDIAPDPSVEARVREIAGHVSGVIGLDKCFVRKMGFDFYVDLHVVVNGELSVRAGHRIAHEVEEKILRTLPHVAEVLVHIEPEEELALKPSQRDYQDALHRESRVGAWPRSLHIICKQGGKGGVGYRHLVRVHNLFTAW